MKVNRLLSAEQVMERLNIKRSTFWKMVLSGELPSIKIGRLRRVPEQALKAWIIDKTKEAGFGVYMESGE